MCTVSMIYDHYRDKWDKKWNELDPFIKPIPVPVWPVIPKEEIDEFKELLRRAREYDKKHNQEDCELEEKKQKVKELAEKLGVKVDFLE